jgi:ABC-type glycerol-3-phosphate transport system substrate-binding protein
MAVVNISSRNPLLRGLPVRHIHVNPKSVCSIKVIINTVGQIVVMMSEQNGRFVNRRNIVKSLGAAGIAGLAGCSSSDDEATTSTDSNGGDDGATTGTDSGTNANGTTIELWSLIHGQSQIANDFLEQIIQQYEQETNNSVRWVKENTQNVQNGNWRQRMNQGNIPQLFNTAASRTGAFVADDLITPYHEIIPELNDEVVNGTEWADDVLNNVYRGFEGDGRKIAPIGFVMQEPFVARADHFEEAGLDIESDFPPENYEELIDVATTLQQEGPGDYGFQVHGSPGDLMDEITPTWSHALGGTEGLYVNEDWDDTLLDSDAWKTTLQRNVEIHRDLELSAPNSATTSDEDACRLVIDGSASMSQVGMLNYGLLAGQAPDMIEDGTLQFGPAWEGESGYRGQFNIQSIAMGAQPPNMADSTWENKRAATIEFLNLLFSPEIQQQVFDKWGLLPYNQNAWEEVPRKENGIVDTAITIAEGSEFGWQAHPNMADIQYNIPGPVFQQAMTGELTAEEACNQAAQQIRQQVFR